MSNASAAFTSPRGGIKGGVYWQRKGQQSYTSGRSVAILMANLHSTPKQKRIGLASEATGSVWLALEAWAVE